MVMSPESMVEPMPSVGVGMGVSVSTGVDVASIVGDSSIVGVVSTAPAAPPSAPPAGPQAARNNKPPAKTTARIRINPGLRNSFFLIYSFYKWIRKFI
jgi:hypothetical protein